MLRLTTVFADHALFQHTAPLTVRGVADSTVTISIERDGILLSSATGIPGEDGRFAICLMTPPASFAPCTLRAATDTEHIVRTDILFGELWLAGGQSNMELPNGEHPDYSLRRSGFIESGVRAYQPYPFPFDDPMPRTPEFFGEGSWYRASDEGFSEVAALASIFCQRISTALGVPVGFLNVNRGCTRIETWIPARMMDDELRDYLIKTDRLPTDENWNTFGDRTRYIEKNFQQFSSYYNRAVAPLSGVSVRGVLWYQGGSNRAEHCKYGYYPTLLDILRRSWREDFGIPDERFPFYVSALYPYTDGNETVSLGRFVADLSALALSRPTEYYLLPISDLSPAWAVHAKNHPVHPVNKYHQGERFSRLVLDTLYRPNGTGQLPATLAEVTRAEGAITLRFRDVGDGLFLKGEAPHGLYIADGEGHYLPAECEITAPDTLRLTHPAIESPCEAAYAIRTAETECNLFAGAYPVTPFFTAPHDTWGNIRIEKRPWCELCLDGDLRYLSDVDVYRHAIFTPLPGSGACYDRDYTLGARSLRVYTDAGEGKEFGVRIDSYNGARLDLGCYRALRMGVFPLRCLTAELHLLLSDGSVTVIPATEGQPLPTPGWGEIEFSLADVPTEAVITAMEWRFRRTEGVAFGVVSSPKEADGINLDRIYLVP